VKKRRMAPAPVRAEGVGASPTASYGGFERYSSNGLTLHERSVGLPDDVRELLDWLIDEELRRWQGRR
jgi:hypothetical protein